MIAFTCPHCGGRIRYDISEKDMKCEYCDSLITKEDYQAYLDAKTSYQTTELTCPQCGAVTLSYDNTIATFCSYCGSSVVFNQRVREEQKPDGILPFGLQKKAARSRYRELVDTVLLAPDWMREEGETQITGLYVPYYQYSATMEQPGVFRSSTTEHYSRYTEVKTYEITGLVQADYRGQRFDAAMAFPDAMSETIDHFNWEKVEGFQPAYLAGYYADGSDVEGAEYDPVAMTLIQEDINGQVLHYSGMDLNPANTANDENVILRRKKILYPVWLLTHRVGKKRICYAAVNGRTGEVAADIPMDRWKYLKVSLILAAVFSIIMNFVYTIKPASFLLISMLITALFGIALGNLARDLYVREHHLDDIGRVGFETFAASLKRNIFRSRAEVLKQPPARKRGCVWWVLLILLLFFAGPIAATVLEHLLPKSWPFNMELYGGSVGLVLVAAIIFSAISRRAGSQRAVRWRFNTSKLASFALLWKIWVALAAGALVYCSGTIGDNWYYAAGILNILVCVWGAFDLIRGQNRLASREVPVFTIQRGGQE